jgi:hypothetical protein
MDLEEVWRTSMSEGGIAGRTAEDRTVVPGERGGAMLLLLLLVVLAALLMPAIAERGCGGDTVTRGDTGC